jgi:hypothetical protein
MQKLLNKKGFSNKTKPASNSCFFLFYFKLSFPNRFLYLFFLFLVIYKNKNCIIEYME